MAQTYILTCELEDTELREIEDMLDRFGKKHSFAVMSKEKAEQRLFRFEWFFDGERQMVGLFNMLEEITKLSAQKNWTKCFSELLPVPIKVKEPCSFWFTEFGINRLGSILEDINANITGTGWELRVAQIVAHESLFLYQDDLQVALDEDVLENGMFEQFDSLEAIMLQENQ